MSKPCIPSTADIFFSQIVFSHHTMRKKKEGTQITTSPKKKDNNSKRAAAAAERHEPGVFFGPSDKHLDHTIEMVNKKKSV